jgi:general secretion pathway protein J
MKAEGGRRKEKAKSSARCRALRLSFFASLHPSSFRLHPSKGFTLIELLIAIAIFAVMAGMAYRGLQSVLDARERTSQENRKWRELTLFFARMEADMTAVVDRDIRDSGDLKAKPFEGKLQATKENEGQLTFTRMGLPGQTGTLAAPQRFAYRLRDKTIEQLVWPVLDQAPRSEPAVYPLLDNVTELRLRYLGADKQWREVWPPQANNPQQQKLPNAVEVAITLASGQQITRLFALPL